MADQTDMLGLEAWKATLFEGKAPPAGAVLRKAYIPDEVRAVEGQDRVLRFVISTGTVDRDRDTIDPAGWELGPYLANPVVMWAHDYRQLPIAKTLSLQVDGERLVADTQFATPDLNPFAETVYRMLLGGFLRGASVGFRPKEHKRNDERQGVDFLKQELLEFSVVPVPSNPEAGLVQAALAAGLDIGPLATWCEGVLGNARGKGAWVLHGRGADDEPALMRKSYLGFEEYGFTAPAGGTTSPVHVHDYGLDIEHEEGMEPQFMGGSAYSVADHSHRITEASLARGETEASDGHVHRLMTAALVRAAIEAQAAKGVVPGNVSNTTADEADAWIAPTLGDFTAKPWGELSATERQHIAGHFAWAVALPPERFGDLKLPHHRPSDGDVVWRGVAAGMAALLGARGGVDIPDADRQKVYAHLAAHYRQFNKPVPEFRAAIEEGPADGSVGKMGRVLSAENEGKLRQAVELIQGVLAQLDEEPKQEGAAVASKSAMRAPEGDGEELVLELADEEPGIGLSTEEVDAVLATVLAATREEVRGVVTESVAAAVRSATGRVL